jgi:hypothetical protein
MPPSAAPTNPSSASPRKGFESLNSGLRSVLGHALGLHLVLLLDFLKEHDSKLVAPDGIEEWSYIRFRCTEYLKRVFVQRESVVHRMTTSIVTDAFAAVSDRNEISVALRATLQSWCGKTKKERTETALTKALSRTIDQSPLMKSKEASAEATCRSTGEGSVADLEESGRYDVLISHRTRGAPILLFEFGIVNEKWWHKVDQGIAYVNILSNHESAFVANNTVTVKQFGKNPMMMAIVTIDKVSLDFRIGIFLCWHDVTEEIDPATNLRLYVVNPVVNYALLWRRQSNVGDTILQKQLAFSDAVANATVCALWLQNLNPLDGYTVLGPNCSYVKETICNRCNPHFGRQCRWRTELEWVIRCYDNRFRGTDRTPEVYFAFQRNGSSVGEAVLRIYDNPNNVDEFGIVKEDEPLMSDRYEWMWKETGQLLILVTCYIPGKHFARRPADFLPIIVDLVLLHEQSFVHCDIRCFNIAISGNEGKLIDLDYGGRVGSVHYPKHYEASLADGVRQRFVKEKRTQETVPKWHDWFALGNVVLTLHEIEPPVGKKGERLATKFGHCVRS